MLDPVYRDPKPISLTRLEREILLTFGRRICQEQERISNHEKSHTLQDRDLSLLDEAR